MAGNVGGRFERAAVLEKVRDPRAI